MNRTILLLVLFAVLGIGSYIALSGDKKDSAPTSMVGADRNFAVKDIDRVHKIFIADRQGNQSTLSRRNNSWVYNEKYKVNPNAMRNLLDAVQRIEMKYKPADAAVKTMIKNLATEGLKVEVYDQQDELIKAYYVGGATPDERGTYIIMENAEQPYVGSIPGWEGNIRFRYSLKGEDWRDKTVLSANPNEISEISIEYPKQRDKSFRLQKNGKQYVVEPFYEVTPKFKAAPSKANVERFLVNFERIGAEAFENRNPRRDSVLNTIPFCTIRLKREDGVEQSVRLFPIYTSYGAPTDELVERYFADVNDGEDFMLVQNRLFKDVLWAYDFFFQGNS